MNSLLEGCRRASDEELSASLVRLRREERENLAAIIAHLVEFEARDLPLRKAQPSLFHYCVRVLGYSEAEAGWRTYSARAAKRFPIILEMLQTGRLHLTAVVTLGPRLTEENHREVLEKAAGLTKIELEFLAAGLAPQPDRADVARSLPMPVGRQAEVHGVVAANDINSAPSPASPGAAMLPSAPRDVLEPLRADRLRIAFTAGRRFMEKLQRARELMRHKIPNGSFEGVFEHSLDYLLAARDPQRRQESRKARARIGSKAIVPSRLIPQCVKDEVWTRDDGRCAFVGQEGDRCGERGGIELDHIEPWALGGSSRESVNIRLLCRSHNQLLARLRFGAAATRRREPAVDRESGSNGELGKPGGVP